MLASTQSSLCNNSNTVSKQSIPKPCALCGFPVTQCDVETPLIYVRGSMQKHGEFQTCIYLLASVIWTHGHFLSACKHSKQCKALGNVTAGSDCYETGWFSFSPLLQRKRGSFTSERCDPANWGKLHSESPSGICCFLILLTRRKTHRLILSGMYFFKNRTSRAARVSCTACSKKKQMERLFNTILGFPICQYRTAVDTFLAFEYFQRSTP